MVERFRRRGDKLLERRTLPLVSAAATAVPSIGGRSSSGLETTARSLARLVSRAVVPRGEGGSAPSSTVHRPPACCTSLPQRNTVVESFDRGGVFAVKEVVTVKGVSRVMTFHGAARLDGLVSAACRQPDQAHVHH